MLREKDQTLCPKCGRMYCEGYWGEGVCTADMSFCSEPTAKGDQIALYVRQWYEAHRESWWDRHLPFAERKGVVADNFILGFMQEVSRVETEAERQTGAKS